MLEPDLLQTNMLYLFVSLTILTEKNFVLPWRYNIERVTTQQYWKKHLLPWHLYLLFQGK